MGRPPTGPAAQHALAFGPFEVDVHARQLLRQGVVLRLRGQPFDILVALLERPGEVVTREDLRRRLWPDGTTVDFDHSLNAAVNKLREVLRDSAEKPRFIETLPRVGYRFVAPVHGKDDPRADSTVVSLKPPIRVGGARARLRVLVLVLGAALAASWQAWRAHSPRERTMIAVLPFDNLSGDPQLEYLSDGFTEEILTSLGQLNAGLGIIARSSVMRYKHTTEPIDAIGRALGVEYVLEGSVRPAAQRLRVTAQLIRVRDQSHVWAESYDGATQDVLGIQADVARQVAMALSVRLRDAAALPPRPSRAVPPEVREAYLRGRYFWNKRTPAGFAEGIRNFQHALDLDPAYAPAWAGLADCHFLMGTAGYAILPALEAFPLARREAEKALDLDPDLVEAYPTLAAVRNAVDYDWAGAETLYRRAIELNPSYATAYQWYALELAKLGRSREAVARARESHRLDPLSLIVQTVVGLTLRAAGQEAEAEAECRKVLVMDERFLPARGCLATALIDQGKHGDAIRELLAIPAMAQDTPSLLAPLVYAHARSGDRRAALEALGRMLGRNDHAPAPAYYLAEAYCGLGDREKAMESLEKAHAERDTGIEEIGSDPLLDPLRDDPRFTALVRRVGLTPRPTTTRP